VVPILSLSERRVLIDWNERILSIQEQAELLRLNRTGLYYVPVSPTAWELELRRSIDRLNTDYPYYGSRKIAAALREEGFLVARKRVQRLMAEMGLLSIYPRRRNLSEANPAHKKYPYLLRGVTARYPNHIWGTDITYVRLKGGWMYLTVILDWYSRYVLSWSMSEELSTDFVIEALEKALMKRQPEIINSDQGSQYTSKVWEESIRRRSPEIRISMDGRGRCMDNIFTERFWRSYKYEEVYLREYETPRDCRRGTGEYIEHYNYRRPHQALKNKTPYKVFTERVL
jgi:putative transposase